MLRPDLRVVLVAAHGGVGGHSLQLDHLAQRQAALIELDVQFHAMVARAGRNRALMLAREPVSLLYSATLARMQGFAEDVRQGRLTGQGGPITDVDAQAYR